MVYNYVDDCVHEFYSQYLYFTPIDLSSVSYALNFVVRDKKKVFAPNYAAFYPFAFDVFLSPRKIDHIARFVELPAMNSSGRFPPILVVNLQVFKSSLFLCWNFTLMLFRIGIGWVFNLMSEKLNIIFHLNLLGLPIVHYLSELVESLLNLY